MNENKTILLVQNIIKNFIKNGIISFNSFLNSWSELNGNDIHFIKFEDEDIYLNSIQIAFQTFLGYCNEEKTLFERIGGIFGLYLTYFTQKEEIKDPILITTFELKSLIEIKDYNKEILEIINFFIKSEVFCFIINSISINTPYWESPPLIFDNNIEILENYSDLEIEYQNNLKEIRNIFL